MICGSVLLGTLDIKGYGQSALIVGTLDQKDTMYCIVLVHRNSR